MGFELPRALYLALQNWRAFTGFTYVETYEADILDDA